MKNLILLVFFLFHLLTVLAHQDRIITLEEDGSLIGLPENYSNANFERGTFTLTIGKNCIVIPQCIKNLFKDYDTYEIEFRASWYHDPDNIPYYIHMDITTPEEPLGYNIFFNLDTLEIFQIWRPEMIVEENQTNKYLFNEQVISEECQILIAKSIAKI